MLVEHSVSNGQGAAGSSAGVHQGIPVDRSTMPWPDDAGAISSGMHDIDGPPPYYDEGFPGSQGSAHFEPDIGRVSPRQRDVGAMGKQRSGSGFRRTQQRAVTPMAKRLLRLLLAHPGLVEHVGDQQLEILDNSPHLVLVRDLITLANISGARHAGALLEAAEPGSELADVLAPLSTELISEEDLPDPLTEWNDALQRIELDAIKAEQSVLVQSGLRDEASQKRYQELTRRRTLLERAGRLGEVTLRVSQIFLLRGCRGLRYVSNARNIMPTRVAGCFASTEAIMTQDSAKTSRAAKKPLKKRQPSQPKPRRTKPLQRPLKA